jgi:hypothetical protein
MQAKSDEVEVGQAHAEVALAQIGLTTVTVQQYLYLRLGTWGMTFLRMSQPGRHSKRNRYKVLRTER